MFVVGIRVLAGAAVVMAVAAATAAADDNVTRAVVIKGHVFAPAEIRVPAGKRIVLTVENQDATAEEFESSPLHIEKVIAGGGKGIVRFGPLSAGSYAFIGEFHEDTAQGKIVAE